MKLSNIHLTLANVRKEQNLSQQAIAESLNIEQATVSMYENGKRSIPLDLLDAWFDLLCINITITPKGFAPVRPVAEVKDALIRFEQLKKRRNYLIAELRAMMAQKIMQHPVFQKTDMDTGENRFWPYSFPKDFNVGLVETRYDHSDQKYLAVEYTINEVNVYKFKAAHESDNREGEHTHLTVNRMYFSEDDFLTLGGQWSQDILSRQKKTLLRINTHHMDEIEIIGSEGFSFQSLLNMQENYTHLIAVIEETKNIPFYQKMEAKLKTIMNQLTDLSMKNRLENGAIHPEFIFWSEFDHSSVDVPLWNVHRNWKWIEEGVEWVEIF